MSYIYVIQELHADHARRKEYDDAFSYYVLDATTDVHAAVKYALELVGDNPEPVRRKWFGVTLKGDLGVVHIRAFSKVGGSDVEELKPLIDKMFPITEAE